MVATRPRSARCRQRGVRYADVAGGSSGPMGTHVGASARSVELARPWWRRNCCLTFAEVRSLGSLVVGQNDTSSAPLIISRTRSYMDSSSPRFCGAPTVCQQQRHADCSPFGRKRLRGCRPHLRNGVVRILLAVVNIPENLESTQLPTEVGDRRGRAKAGSNVPPRCGRSEWIRDPSQTHASAGPNAGHADCSPQCEPSVGLLLRSAPVLLYVGVNSTFSDELGDI